MPIGCPSWFLLHYPIASEHKANSNKLLLVAHHDFSSCRPIELVVVVSSSSFDRHWGRSSAVSSMTMWRVVEIERERESPPVQTDGRVEDDDAPLDIGHFARRRDWWKGLFLQGQVEADARWFYLPFAGTYNVYTDLDFPNSIFRTRFSILESERTEIHKRVSAGLRNPERKRPSIAWPKSESRWACESWWLVEEESLSQSGIRTERYFRRFPKSHATQRQKRWRR